MTGSPIFAADVEDDVSQAYGWYESRQPGLGEAFLRSLEACFHSVNRNPEIRALVYRNYRKALVRRFPYAVYYELRGSVVHVVAVLHTARDSQKWRERLS